MVTQEPAANLKDVKAGMANYQAPNDEAEFYGSNQSSSDYDDFSEPGKDPPPFQPLKLIDQMSAQAMEADHQPVRIPEKLAPEIPQL